MRKLLWQIINLYNTRKCLGVHVDETLSWDCHVDLIDFLSWQTPDDGRRCFKSVLMYKMLNDHTAHGLRNSFVRRNVDQTNCHLRNTATDLTLPKPKRAFLKTSFKFSGAMLWNQLSIEVKLAKSISSFKSLIRL